MQDSVAVSAFKLESWPVAKALLNCNMLCQVVNSSFSMNFISHLQSSAVQVLQLSLSLCKQETGCCCCPEILSLWHEFSKPVYSFKIKPNMLFPVNMLVTDGLPQALGRPSSSFWNSQGRLFYVISNTWVDLLLNELIPPKCPSVSFFSFHTFFHVVSFFTLPLLSLSRW